MKEKIAIKGLKENDFLIDPDDKSAVKMAMLIEGQCTIGVDRATKKYGFTKQRYYQLLKLFIQGGLEAIMDKKRGPENRSVRTDEVRNQIIRLRFLDPLASVGILAQKMAQSGYHVSKRSIERTITEFGLQKKHMS